MSNAAVVIEGCIACNLCVKECSFLQEYGTPGALCQQYSSAAPVNAPVFECNLCGLCEAVCPKDFSITGAFLEIRHNIQHHDRLPPVDIPVDNRHNQICRYEKFGDSSLLSLFHLPEGSDTVFFPGCTLAATRSNVSLRTYEHLLTIDPSCGIVLSCCSRPSRDLGLSGKFQKSFNNLARRLKKRGVQKIITACPSCYATFREHLPECTTRTIYEELADNPLPLAGLCFETVTIHDTCTTRNVPHIHAAVRTLVDLTGARINEMEHNRQNTLCCGEGAAAAFIAPEHSRSWKTIRQEEAGNSRIITYCAGCSSSFGNTLQTTHLLDLLFDHDRALRGEEQRTRSPLTYLKRLGLKWSIKHNNGYPGNASAANSKESYPLHRVSLLAVIFIVIVGLHLFGVTDLLDSAGVNDLVTRLQGCPPAVYIVLFSIAPVLLLPATPFVVISGLLYGPFWGLIYAMAGATCGATLAFLVSRYLIGDFIQKKLSAPRWSRLFEKVAQHGWKVVATTRLIPIFPFSLVNYAFGMTQVKLSHYILATAICMVPTCCAFVLLSSSITDIIHGEFTVRFAVGAVLAAVVFTIPPLYTICRKGEKS